MASYLLHSDRLSIFYFMRIRTVKRAFLDDLGRLPLPLSNISLLCDLGKGSVSQFLCVLSIMKRGLTLLCCPYTTVVEIQCDIQKGKCVQMNCQFSVKCILLFNSGKPTLASASANIPLKHMDILGNCVKFIDV